MVHEHPAIGCLEERKGSLFVSREYFDRRPEYYEFDGTPLAEKHGGWKRTVPTVEFFHTLSDIVNAIAQAGLRVKRMEETGVNDEQSPLKSKLPVLVGLLALKRG